MQRDVITRNDTTLAGSAPPGGVIFRYGVFMARYAVGWGDMEIYNGRGGGPAERDGRGLAVGIFGEIIVPPLCGKSEEMR